MILLTCKRRVLLEVHGMGELLFGHIIAHDGEGFDVGHDDHICEFLGLEGGVEEKVNGSFEIFLEEAGEGEEGESHDFNEALKNSNEVLLHQI